MPYKDKARERLRVISRREYHRKRFRKLTNVKSTLGYDGEMEIAQLLKIKEKAFRGSNYDFLWKGKKIDVKTGILHEYHGCWGWFFSTQRQKGNVDFYFCVVKDRNAKTRFIFKILDKDFGTKNLWIPLNKIENYYKYIF